MLFMKSPRKWRIHSSFPGEVRSLLVGLLIPFGALLIHAKPPYFGNGMRNGWAEQDSVVIWTRTTRFEEMNQGGHEFLNVPASLEGVIRKEGPASRYVADQLPQGAMLDEMLGACPGFPGEVRLRCYPIDEPEEKIETPWRETYADTDYAVQFKLDGLKAGISYGVELEARQIGEQSHTSAFKGAFKTAHAPEHGGPLRFCVTTCHDFLRRDDGLEGHLIYQPMQLMHPDFVVHAGDIEYYDKPKPWAWTVELMRFKWARLFSMPRNRTFYSQHTTYFIKDDHDTLKNDCWPGQEYGAVTFEEGVHLFNQEQFPTRDPRYHSIRWGQDVEIWLLEGRDYRSSNRMEDGPEKSILGSTQKAWLQSSLRASSATFKLVFTPTPVVGPDRPNKKDNHANEVFSHEGKELRTLFSSVDRTILFCGDRHWQYASEDPTTGLWEFGCGPGSARHQLGWKEGDQRPQHRFLRVAGGYLSGDAWRDELGQPRLVLRHRDVYGEPVSEFAFPR